MSTNHSATLAVEVDFSDINNIKILVESPNYHAKRKRKDSSAISDPCVSGTDFYLN